MRKLVLSLFLWGALLPRLSAGHIEEICDRCEWVNKVFHGCIPIKQLHEIYCANEHFRLQLSAKALQAGLWAGSGLLGYRLVRNLAAQEVPPEPRRSLFIGTIYRAAEAPVAVKIAAGALAAGAVAYVFYDELLKIYDEWQQESANSDPA